MHPLTQAKRDEIKVCLLNGKSNLQTAHDCGVSQSSVSRERIRNGLCRPPRDASTTKKIKQLLLDGISMNKIARECSVPWDKVRRIQFLNDIPANNRRTYDESTLEEIKRQLINGTPVTTVAKDFHVGFQFVRTIKKKASIGLGSSSMRLSANKIEEIKKRLHDGQSAMATAKFCGVSCTTVTKIRNRYKIPITWMTRSKLSATKIEEIKKHLCDGQSASATAKFCGVSRDTIRKITKYYKIPFARRRFSPSTTKVNEIKKQHLCGGRSGNFTAKFCGMCCATVCKFPKHHGILRLLKQLNQNDIDPCWTVEKCKNSKVTARHVEMSRETEGLQVIKEESIELPSLTTSGMSFNITTVDVPLASIEFLDAIPFCILI
ncbi:hypothetical protein BC940DRAFT_308816 [Gongronella butleri]|nr:hypothetical protein BC940DRAFT_308816 [Gongronella butleri]